MESPLAYIPADRRQALALGATLPPRADGAVLFADISGFTPLTEALAGTFGNRRGAEELTVILNQVYDALIGQVASFGGSVIGFSGDAIACWFDQVAGDGVERAVTCGLALQGVMQNFAAIPLPDGGTTALSLKVAVASGQARRCLVGDPAIQQIEVLVGTVVDRMALGEQQAEKGQLVVDAATVAALGDMLQVTEWRSDAATGERFALIGGLRRLAAPAPWPALADLALMPAAGRPWLLPEVYARLAGGYGEFLTELRPATPLFLRFTGIDYEDDAAERRLDTFVRWVQGVLEQYGGSLIQLTTGDKGSYLYAVFGAPIAHEDDSRRAALAALELRNPPADLDFSGAVQIGIAQGMLRTGAYGAASRRTYGALGDSVNLAARLMQHADPGTIIVSSAVQQAAGDMLVFEQLAPIVVKGKRDPVAVARLVRARRTHETRHRFSGALIGRERELATLRNWVAPILAGNFAGIVRVAAEAGMGKSRLIDELRRELVAERRVTWFVAPADELLGRSLQPFRSFLRVYTAQADERTPAENLARFRAAIDTLRASLVLAAQTPGADAVRIARLNAELDRTRPFLQALLDLAVDDPRYERLDPQLRFENTLVALQTVFYAESMLQPVVLQLEDAHWLDDDSRHMVQQLGQDANAYPLVVLLSERLSDAGDLTDLPLAADVQPQIVRLEALSEAGVGAIAAQTLGGPLTDDLLRFLVAKTSGSPLFAQQLALDLRERGAAVADTNGQWRMAVSELAEVPTSLNAVLVARIDRLQAAIKALVQAASVLGPEFELRVLSQMFQDDRQLLAKARQAEAAAIWGALNAARYLFRHALMRDAAYSMQPQSRLRELHALVGIAIEALFGSNDASQAAGLAYHFGQAADEERERRYARQAGVYAAGRFANVEALRYLGRALELTSPADAAAQYELLYAREQVYDLMGNRVAQQQDLAALQALVAAGDDPRLRAHVNLRRIRYADVTGDYPLMITLARETWQLAQAVGDQVTAAAVLLRWARAHWYQGEYDAGLTRCNAALDLARQNELRPLEADCLRLLGNLASAQGNYAVAATSYQAAITIQRELSDRQAESYTLNNLGTVAWYQGDYPRARVLYEESLTIKRETGDRYGQSLALLNLGEVAAVLGDYGAAQTAYEQALQIKRETGDRFGASITLCNLGDIAAIWGAYEQARARYSEALQICRAIGHRQQTALALTRLGFLSRYQGDLSVAVAQSNEAVALARELNDRNTLARALTGLGRALGASDRLTSTQALSEALALRRELNQPTQVVEVLAGLAELDLAAGNLAVAQTHVAAILVHLSAGTLDGAEDPFDVYLCCWRVLQAAGDPRAPELLADAQANLQARAANLTDAELRRRFLEDVPVHRALLAAG